MFAKRFQRCTRQFAIHTILVVLIALPCIAMATTVPKKVADEFPPKDTPEASMIRGEIVFQNYCMLCHGINADGKGRAARIYDPKPANLRMSMKNDAYKELIIRKGGKAMGRSAFMPPWGEELTDEQVTDVVHYLRTIAPANAAK